jgi:hypothetical protein
VNPVPDALGRRGSEEDQPAAAGARQGVGGHGKGREAGAFVRGQAQVGLQHHGHHQPGARFTNFQELFLTRILYAILNRLRIDS